ncbi:hypothetical protein [Paeniglutamicibacter sp. Y32M11]|uniref:hypothetical protein n=1 Tax=Paeniglutamicibacter sp. Y32M11 TaxID=2853258 RepID=UPI00351CD153
MAILVPVVECNRTQVDNGRPYLKEMVFGDHEERHHLGLALSSQSEVAIYIVLQSDQRFGSENAVTLAHFISAIMFLTLAASANATKTVAELTQEIQTQINVLL